MSASRPPYVDQLLIAGQGGGPPCLGRATTTRPRSTRTSSRSVYKKRTDMVKDAMNAAPYGDRDAMVAAILDAIKAGGLFAVDVDIVPTQIGQASHVMACRPPTSGER
jgi:arsenite oxidase large subunit